ncbi:hypothetical protein [Yinghuangia soli]|uniref:Uncharacterized protein n=1 Tax=Yinghuangia soli TaxID=2908204 RepID=A0AA41U1D4_9ACTN|nr:hypothetical protein [Yinghuangia soli]MCF2529501.1 hypothetical protein [Yinghuangia soli]
MALTASGCSSSDDAKNDPRSDSTATGGTPGPGASGTAGGSTPAGLTGALGRIAATPAAKAYLEYADLAALRAANGGTDPAGPYGRLFGIGFPALVNSVREVPAAYSFDPMRADRAWSAGLAPDSASVLIGAFDTKAVEGALVEAGGAKEPSPGAGTTWRTAPDGAVDLQSAKLPGVLAAFNVVRLADDRIVHGPSAATVNAVDAGGADTLGNNGPHRVLADCLGETLVAVIAAPGTQKPAPVAAPLTAVGVRGAKGEAPTEVLCVPARDAAAAEQAAGKLRTELAQGVRPDGRPWADVLADVRVETVGTTVRVTAHPAGSRPAGVLHQALLQGALPDMSSLGGS